MLDRPALSARDVAKFTATMALLAIFADATLGHGLAWHNDPYWTYWVTKTFLIATIFGLGTAWLGIGEWRGAAITLVHTLVLTVYYWSLSPVGLPSSPEWLDLEHTWITGVPIHFGVIYLGYLAALWLWRRRALPDGDVVEAAPLALRALIVGVAFTVVAGGLSAIALAHFPGVTFYVTRILLSVVFLLFWWSAAGRDTTAAVVGAVTLALLWAGYAQYLGPNDVAAWPPRLFDAAPPASHPVWLTYDQLWVISFPIYLVSAIVLLLADARWRIASTVMGRERSRDTTR